MMMGLRLLKIRYENAAALGIMGGFLVAVFLFGYAIGVNNDSSKQFVLSTYLGSIYTIMILGIILTGLLIVYNTVHQIIKYKNIRTVELLKIFCWGIAVSIMVCVICLLTVSF
jgi:hypothetical protein